MMTFSLLDEEDKNINMVANVYPKDIATAICINRTPIVVTLQGHDFTGGQILSTL